MPDSIGLGGLFVGVHNNALIIAGGANFPGKAPWLGGIKVWYDGIYVFYENEHNEYILYTGDRLARPLAYGASVSTKNGVILIGGEDSERCYATVYRLKWNSVKKKIDQDTLPSLPVPCSYLSAALVDEKIYVAGGQQAKKAERVMNNFWCFDLEQINPVWTALDPWQGPPRRKAVAVSHLDGQHEYFYLISGQNLEEASEASTKLTFLKDAYRYNPQTNQWLRLPDLPVPVCAATGLSLDERFVAIFGGSSGIKKDSDSIENHPGFSKRILVYNSLTDSWENGGSIPEGVVTTTATKWGKNIIIPSGEIRPGVRTPMIYIGKMEQRR